MSELAGERVSEDFSFINRSLLISTFVTFLVVISSFVYYNKNFALGALAGGVWNIINVYFLTRLVKVISDETLQKTCPPKLNAKALLRSFGASKKRRRAVQRRRIAYLVFIKFLLLYGAGFLILRYSGVSLYGVLVGFSIFFLVISLKAIGAAIVDRSSAHNS